MRETIQSHENSDERPIGRFLLGLDEYEGRHDPYEYARDFARTDGNFQRYKHISREVPDTREIEVDGRKVDLKFEISRYAYIWRIIVFAERHRTEHLSTNYQPHGGEVYDLYCATPKPAGKYYEYGNQRNIIRQREFNSPEQIRILQGVVERLVDI
jgi:hypothetical protein